MTKQLKLILNIAAILSAALLLPGADKPPQAAMIPHDKAAAEIAKGGVLVSQPDIRVQGGHRTGPGEVEIHDKETDALYILDGEATFITGGKMIGGKQTAPGQIRGTSIEGGETHHLTKGDVIVVPAGMPHWFKEVKPVINYYVVKSIRP